MAAALAAVFFTGAGQAAGRPSLVEVVITLDGPPLATAVQQSRVLTARTKALRLDLRTPSSVAYVRSLAAVQRTLAARIVGTIPAARVTWRYQVVLNGMAVVLPRSELGLLESVPGVAKVWPSLTYRPLLDRSPKLIGADLLWGAPGFTTAGNGIKIGIIDDGVDQAHPFFNAAGYTMPPGFPKGNVGFTTAKVIVARAFSPPTNTWKYAKTPFDPEQSEHATHVAGIAAGNYYPGAIAGRGPLSGVAPRAYLGNYKVLTVPTENFGLNGNGPEIAAGVEAAVKDGMDIVNLSLGEDEIEPSRDLVVAAVNAAADAGVIPTIAAGNDFDEFGRGSISSPGSAVQAITAAAVSKQLVVASFSSSGPSPASLGMKPDVAAPGVDITSSVPPSRGTWTSFSGTSMAAPHVAGAAALLKQRHPDWTVAQVKSALVLTGRPVVVTSTGGEAPTTREGGGIINVPTANDPKLFAAPADLSFGLLRPGASAVRSIDLTDAGGGAGTWTVAVSSQEAPPGVTVTFPLAIAVPGRLDVTAAAAAGTAEAEATGFITLTLGSIVRRIPYWFRVAAPVLAQEPFQPLAKPGIYHGQTRGKAARVTAYRYPETPRGPTSFPGPEQVFQLTLRKPVANFGVVVTGGAKASPRVLVGRDEDHLVGNTGVPLVNNPYLDAFHSTRPVAGAVRPAPGVYGIVFDTPTGTVPGAFTFRFWIDDVTPPAVQLLTPAVRPRSRLELTATDGGSGVDPLSVKAFIDGRAVDAATARGRILISIAATTRGLHRLEMRVADYQELKNMENVPQILPNTRIYKATFRVR